jgi:hypothetical protein
VQALEHDARAPILALAHLASDVRSFLFAHEMEVVDEAGRASEHDLWAIADGRLLIGEAGTTGTLGGNLRKRIGRLVHVAAALTADEVVLATTADDWEPRVTEREDCVFTASLRYSRSPA